MSLGKRIREARHKKGWTQTQLGEQCGMVDVAIRRYESDRGNPTLLSLNRIASALDVSVGFLLGFDEPVKPRLPSEFNDFALFIESHGYYVKLEDDQCTIYKDNQSVKITVSELKDLVKSSKAVVAALVQTLMDQNKKPPQD